MSTKDEKLTCLDFRLEEARVLDERSRRAEASFDVAVNLLEKRLELFEVEALFAARNFLGLTLLGAGADVAQVCDVG